MANEVIPEFRTFAWKTDPHMTERLGQMQHDAAQLPAFPNQEDAWEALSNSVKVMKEVSARLLKADYEGDYCEHCERKGQSPESLAKTLSYVAKTVDEVTRLLEFSQGRADSRPDNGIADLMKLLTPEQWNTFQSWISQPQAIDVTT
jgi:hypothetical protein